MRLKPFLPVLLCSLLGAAVPAAADQGTAKILAPWEANGQLFQVAVDKLQFIGTFEGIMYIEHGEGLLDAALFTCPSTQITEILSNASKAHGYCTIESPNGDFIYAEYTCDGQPGACTGTFVLTGGTGKLTGITGQSDLIVRTALSGTTIDQADRRDRVRGQGSRDLAGDALRDPRQERRCDGDAGHHRQSPEGRLRCGAQGWIRKRRVDPARPGVPMSLRLGRGWLDR